VKFFAAVVAVALWGNRAQAGLYNPAEPWENMLHLSGRPTNPRPVEFSTFVLKLFELRTVAMDGIPDNPVRLRYSLVADLSPGVALSRWPIERKISLSGYQIRRGKHREAIELLYPVAVRERNNFLISANLATAYQQDKQEGRAVDYLEQTLSPSAWPRACKDVGKDMKALLERIGWTEEMFLWYREAETHHLKLARLRAREAIKRENPETLDKLFDVDFRYEGDKLPEKEKAKIPANALAVVQQLLIWLPEDPRLYWLLGELYHARGTPEELAAARRVFTDLAGFNGRYRVPGTIDHLRALGPAPAVQPSVTETEPQPVAAPPAGDSGAIFDFRPVLIGFGAGVLVSFLAYWQIRELRRRGHNSGG
jgi:hypothetical protein